MPGALSSRCRMKQRPGLARDGACEPSTSAMKSVVTLFLGIGCGLATLHASPADLVVVAAMKLPDAANYSWLTSVDDDARSYTIDGQTDRASDYSLVTMPVVAAIRRRAGTGSSNSGNLSTVVFKGDEKFVV